MHILSTTLFLSFLFFSRFPPSPPLVLGFRVGERRRGAREGENEREVADLNSTYYSRRRLSDIFLLFFARGEIRRVIVHN